MFADTTDYIVRYWPFGAFIVAVITLAGFFAALVSLHRTVILPVRDYLTKDLKKDIHDLTVTMNTQVTSMAESVEKIAHGQLELSLNQEAQAADIAALRRQLGLDRRHEQGAQST